MIHAETLPGTKAWLVWSSPDVPFDWFTEIVVHRVEGGLVIYADGCSCVVIDQVYLTKKEAAASCVLVAAGVVGELHRHLSEMAAVLLEEDDAATPPPTVEQTVNLLLLAEGRADQKLVAAWTDEQRVEVCKWAWLEHLSAGDNDVDRVPRPSFMPPAKVWGE